MCDPIACLSVCLFSPFATINHAKTLKAFSFGSATFGNEPLGAGLQSRLRVGAVQVWGFGADAMARRAAYEGGVSVSASANGADGVAAAPLSVEAQRSEAAAAAARFISGGQDTLWI
jgi:hypothetical protein